MEKLLSELVFKLKGIMKKASLIILVLILSSCNGYIYDNKDLEKILGVKVNELDELYTYEEASGIQGEGYVFNKYKLSKKTVDDFLQLKTKNSFPRKDSYKKDWQLLNWKKGLRLNTNILDLFTVFQQHDNSALSEELSELKTNLNSSNNYYSIFFKDSFDEPYAIEIFVLNPFNRTLWVINITT